MKFSLGLLLLAVAMAGSALAGIFTWKGDDAGVWSEPANWEPAGVPGCGDIAYFTRDVTITSDFSVTAGAAAQLVLSNDTGTALTLDCSVGGTGGLHKAGDGSLHLKKANPFAGDFTTLGVSNCAWQVGAKGFSCEVFIYDGAALGRRRRTSTATMEAMAVGSMSSGRWRSRRRSVCRATASSRGISTSSTRRERR